MLFKSSKQSEIRELIKVLSQFFTVYIFLKFNQYIFTKFNNKNNKKRGEAEPQGSQKDLQLGEKTLKKLAKKRARISSLI